MALVSGNKVREMNRNSQIYSGKWSSDHKYDEKVHLDQAHYLCQEDVTIILL